MPIDIESAATRFAALGHPGRMKIVHLLAEAGETGMTPTEIARAADMVMSTASGHLKWLQQAGLIGRRRVGRDVAYAAAFDELDVLAALLRTLQRKKLHKRKSGS
jgi:DNA-binding transcriptional ArsR family regulator